MSGLPKDFHLKAGDISDVRFQNGTALNDASMAGVAFATASVPEPRSMALAAVGLLGVGLAAHERRKAKSAVGRSDPVRREPAMRDDHGR